MAPRAWDAGHPVSARGRFYVKCPANAATVLQEGDTAGQAGDELDWIWLFPTNTAPGLAQILDGIIPVWTWPAGVALNDARPIFVPLNLRSLSGAWSISLPATFTATAAGAFS